LRLEYAGQAVVITTLHTNKQKKPQQSTPELITLKDLI
jgi:hypothetical protein